MNVYVITHEFNWSKGGIVVGDHSLIVIVAENEEDAIADVVARYEVDETTEKQMDIMQVDPTVRGIAAVMGYADCEGYHHTFPVPQATKEAV